MIEIHPPCPYECDLPLSDVGYYRIGGRAAWLLKPRSVAELASGLAWVRSRNLPLIVTGKGSNMLFSDDDFPGAVVTMASMTRIFWLSDNELFCEAGADNSDVALELLKAGRGGGEWLYRLPGMIGSTVRMNGRCYGREVSEVTKGVVAVGLDLSVRWLERSEIFRGYKETSLMDGAEIVCGVLLEFPERKAIPEIRSVMDDFERDREAKHQFDFPSCGSTFKNNYAAGRPSGQIFESLGFKGCRIGGAKVSDHHANFIFNTGDAKASDVLSLAAAMRTAARESAGVALELEVQCAGLFDSALLDECGIASVSDPSRPGKAWAGLLHFPESADGCFPRMLLQGPLLAYSGDDCRFPEGVFVQVEQLAPIAEARNAPDAPFIRWTTTDRSGHSFPLRSDAPSGAFVDRLWDCSVTELFIGNEEGYLEFEVTPEGQWVAIRFDAPRRRASGHDTPSATAWGGAVRAFSGSRGFGMELSLALLEPFVGSDGSVALQCCASPGDGRYGLFPWWHDPGIPDFHQPSRFCPVRIG